MAAKEQNVKILVKNRKAYSFYEIVDKFEAGMALLGTEVKSVREGKISIKEAYCRIEKGEIFLINSTIAEFTHANINNHDPVRNRKLLLHKWQINRITKKINEKGFTCIPLQVYVLRNRIKIEIALVKGKKEYDRKADIKRRDMKRDLEKQMKELNRG